MNYLENSFFIFENKINMFPSIDSTTTEFRIAEVDVSMCYVYILEKFLLAKKGWRRKKDSSLFFSTFTFFQFIPSVHYIHIRYHKFWYPYMYHHSSTISLPSSGVTSSSIQLNFCPLPSPIFSDSVKIISWRIVSTDFHQFLLFTNFFYPL